MQAFNLSRLLAETKAKDQTWLEFLKASSLSMGLYCLKAGQADQQRPHTADEVYYVVSGNASFRAGDEMQAVASGTVILVERSVEHRFFDITEDLTLLVFFAPPEGSLNEGATK
jgi:mannose-6-phosphate isomerase-like protein (cupin superfamily)